ALIELVAEADDRLMERFFEEGTLTSDELIGGLRRATSTGKVFPLVCTSGLLNIGVQTLLDAMVAYLPSPTERPFNATRRQRNGSAGGEQVAIEASEAAPYSAYVWKTVADPFAGRITLFRVVTGTLKADATVYNLTRDTGERLGHLLVLQGKTHTTVPELKAGDIGAVAKLKETQTGDTLADKTAAFEFPKMKFPEPLLAYAIEPRSRGDEDKISTALHRLQEEDPTIHYSRDPQTKEALLQGRGRVQIEGPVARMTPGLGGEGTWKRPRTPYRKTITMPPKAPGRHKKQTGGHGQFGDCKIRLEPLPRGADFEFADEIFGGAIPR